MHILAVTQVMLDQPHGGARHVGPLARELARLGHGVTLVAPGREREREGVARVRPAAWLRPGLRMEAALAALVARTVRRARPDVAYVRLSASSSAVPALLAALRVPIVLELSGPILADLRALGRSRLAIAAVRACLRRAVALARHLVAFGPRIADHAARELGAGRVSVVDDGVDLDAAVPGDRHAARRRLGLDATVTIVTFAGSLVPQQRFDLLLEAHREMPGVTLLIVGGGPWSERLHQAARGATPASPIVVTGAVDHERAILAIRAADACVNAHAGGLGMKCFEYAALGRRFAALTGDGAARARDLYPGLEAVHLVDETPAALRRGLRAALEAEARLGPLPADAIERVRRTVGWEHAARRIAVVLGACA